LQIRVLRKKELKKNISIRTHQHPRGMFPGEGKTHGSRSREEGRDQASTPFARRVMMRIGEDPKRSGEEKTIRFNE